MGGQQRTSHRPGRGARAGTTLERRAIRGQLRPSLSFSPQRTRHSFLCRVPAAHPLSPHLSASPTSPLSLAYPFLGSSIDDETLGYPTCPRRSTCALVTSWIGRRLGSCGEGGGCGGGEGAGEDAAGEGGGRRRSTLKWSLAVGGGYSFVALHFVVAKGSYAGLDSFSDGRSGEGGEG